MAHYVDIETLKYLLYDVHDLESVLEQNRFSDYNREAIDMMLDSVKDFADKELFPYFKEMDEQPAHFRDGEIIVHPQVRKYLKAAAEMGFFSSTFSIEHGGMQMPSMATNASTFIQEAANNHLPGYIGLTVGAAELIAHFGSQALKDIYLSKMMDGSWGGTMCLTEPQAGSSLSDIVSSATADGDAYKISGQKIFISAGDYKGAENIVHLVLARIKGAPAGTKGISLFVVPKNRPNDEGVLESNDVVTTADFQKMGQKGYCTTHLFFGEKENCRGWLVGEANQGLKYMFLMMNGARIGVGRGAVAIASAAYQASLQYAKERPQGRQLGKTGKKDAGQEQTLIINHPDVRRMLLTQKVITEGALSLILLASRYQDLAHAAEGPEEARKYKLLLEILTPIVKTYPSEMGVVSVNQGVQVLGGYGFCSDYILQQYLRDIRISAIYEGTTGIQSQDLLGRKIPMENGEALTLLATEIHASIQKSMAYEKLSDCARKLGEKLALSQKVLATLGAYAQKGDYQKYLADATVFMEFFSNIIVAWQWLEIAYVAHSALLMDKKQYSAEFYESKIHAMQFYFKYELTKTKSLAEILLDPQSLTISSDAKVFV